MNKLFSTTSFSLALQDTQAFNCRSALKTRAFASLKNQISDAIQ
jgi:hypothetical protein